MKRTPDAEDPTWTLQYALQDSSLADEQQVAAPSAVMKEWPQIPEDLEKKYAQRLVVVGGRGGQRRQGQPSFR